MSPHPLQPLEGGGGGGALTVVVADAVLFPGVESFAATSVAASVSVVVVATVGAVALIVIASLGPGASEAAVQVTTWPAVVHEPTVAVAVPTVTPAGRVSV